MRNIVLVKCQFAFFAYRSSLRIKFSIIDYSIEKRVTILSHVYVREREREKE